MAKRRAWRTLQNVDVHDRTENRDVYEDQQLERSKIEEKQSPVGRIIAAALASVLVFIGMWLVFSLMQGVLSHFSSVSRATAARVESDVLSDEAKSSLEASGGSVNSGSPYLYEFFNGATGRDYRVIVDPNTGALSDEVYDMASDAPMPDWYKNATSSSDSAVTDDASGADASGAASDMSFQDYILQPSFNKIVASLAAALITFGLMYTVAMRNLQAQNLMRDTTDINQNQNDQHIALPEEVQRKFDFFPDAGAHSNVQVNSMISHMMLMNKGIKPVKVGHHALRDETDEDGDIVVYKGELIVNDETGEPVVRSKPMFDAKFAEDLFDASGALSDKDTRKYYDATKIPYNPGNKDREKLKGYEHVSDLINGDWHIPAYETQRPAGAYVVDTNPVNTMVLAITRAGKGQTVIEPTIDMWTREDQPNNMVVNDPKGELLKKFYVPGTYRGFQIVQFNLINAMNTDIYNPLMLAAEAARNGDFIKCQTYVRTIADVFFPADAGDDPVWPNAASNAFQRAAFGLIDYYLEEEVELRAYAEATHMDERTLETKLDTLWGHVTLYNCYQFFTELTSKKKKNPAAVFSKESKAGKYDDLSHDEFDAKVAQVKAEAELWADAPECDLLTLYFNATSALPQNQIRTLAGNANKALRAMAGAEKMMASVYGIAITAMSFFTDQTISTLTSGTPSQNVDLAGLSFPRRLGFRLNADFLRAYHLLGMQCVWHAYADKNFTKDLGPDFVHEDIINRAGWARYYFKGIFPAEVAYLKCEIKNAQTSQLVRTFYFQFKKLYQTSLSGRTYMKDPILGEKIVKDGVMRELRPKKADDGSVSYVGGHVRFKSERIVDIDTQPHIEKVRARAITQFMLNYSEKPRMIFLVTPPHLMSYAKLILILVKQLVDLNFDQSYVTKDNQKPLYKTRYMLDELGNLQSDGHGIQGLQTMLSIGLGQDQLFTLILQTLQQLRDVYGDSVDKIVQGNVSNIVFLKSTDDSMIDTLQKMSGTTHKALVNSKTITKDTEAVFQSMSGNEGKVSYTMATSEVPVVTYNDMAFISPRNSIVFRAGDSPIWNRNETILPMSWRLLRDTIKQPGHEYTFQTIPTLSSAKEFDVRRNQPNFDEMLKKRLAQARCVADAKQAYMSVHDYKSDYDVSLLDPDIYAASIMEVINAALHAEASEDQNAGENMNKYLEDEESVVATSEPNKEQLDAMQASMQAHKAKDTKIFAEGCLSVNDLVGGGGGANHGLDEVITRAFVECKGAFTRDRDNFMFKGGSLWTADGSEVLIASNTSVHNIQAAAAAINDAAKDPASTTYATDELSVDDVKKLGTYTVSDAMYMWLASQLDWTGFADGTFEREMARLLRE